MENDNRFSTESRNESSWNWMAGRNSANSQGGQIPGILMVLNDQGGGYIKWNYEELSPTLRSQMNHHEPIVVIENEVYIPKTKSFEESK